MSEVKRVIDVVKEIEQIDAVTFEEGGQWQFGFQSDQMVHAIRLNDGRIWDAVNGWRDEAKAAAQEPAPRPLTIVIATPIADKPTAGMAWSVANAMVHLMVTGASYPEEIQCGWEIMKGSNLAQQRQQLVSRALHMKATHILFWDADIKAPADCIVRLLNHSKAVVLANYVTKEIVSRPTVYLDGDDYTGPLWTKPGDTGLVGDVARAGLGLALFDAQTFYCIDLPWFEFRATPPEFISIGGEDHHLFDKLREKGIPIFCDQDLSQEIVHQGDFDYTPEWAWRAEQTRQKIYNDDAADPEERKILDAAE